MYTVLEFLINKPEIEKNEKGGKGRRKEGGREGGKNGGKGREGKRKEKRNRLQGFQKYLL